MIEDIREEKTDIDGIQYADGFFIRKFNNYIVVEDSDGDEAYLTDSWDDFDNLIKALYRARELWKPK